uniref:Uncharacterized protein n=1 Tax=Brassica campestris TaxID=3711 RepID=A0A3P5YE49_BRACM|nr:unnamed protein product [Brassica rapa]
MVRLFVFCQSSVSIQASQIMLWTLFICRDKQRKEASRLQAVNRKLTAMNKLLMEENDRLHSCRSKCHTWFMKTATSALLPAKDTSCESVVTSGLEPTRVCRIDRQESPSWFCECRAVDVMNVLYSYEALEK